MGKETKIGIVVLIILLLVFSAALGRRLTRSSAESDEAISTGQDMAAERAEKSSVAAKLIFTSIAAEKATVLSPTTLSAGASKRPPDDATTSWPTVSNAPKNSSTAGRTATSAQTPYVPAAPIPASPADNRYAVANDAATTPPATPQSATSTAQAARVDAASPIAAKEPSDPFHSRNDRNVSMSAATTGVGAARMEPSSTASTYFRREGSSSSPASSHSSGSASSAFVYPQTSSYTPGPALGSGSSYPSVSPYSSASGYSSAASQNSNSSDYAYAVGPSDAGRACAAGGTYAVQPNDNFWVISEKVYGTGAYFKALAEHNREKVAGSSRLRVGETLATPTVAQLEQSYPDLCPKGSRREAARSRASLASMHTSYAGGRTYQVQEGDTLFDIARNELGKASRWGEIYELNREALGKDFDYLTPGMRLTLPAKDAAPTGDKTTQRTGTLYDR